MMKLCKINSEEEFVSRFYIGKDKSVSDFVRESISFHNRLYSWTKNPILAVENDGELVSALFYNNTKDKYCSIINIITPVEFRNRGLAKFLIEKCIEECYDSGARRIRLNCNIGALEFYNKLGLIYWGFCKSRDLYCNLPLLSNDIKDLQESIDLPMDQLIPDEKVYNNIRRKVWDEYSSDSFLKTKNIISQNRSRYFYDRFQTLRK